MDFFKNLLKEGKEKATVVAKAGVVAGALLTGTPAEAQMGTQPDLKIGAFLNNKSEVLSTDPVIKNFLKGNKLFIANSNGLFKVIFIDKEGNEIFICDLKSTDPKKITKEEVTTCAFNSGNLKNVKQQ